MSVDGGSRLLKTSLAGRREVPAVGRVPNGSRGEPTVIIPFETYSALNAAFVVVLDLLDSYMLVALAAVLFKWAPPCWRL